MPQLGAVTDEASLDERVERLERSAAEARGASMVAVVSIAVAVSAAVVVLAALFSSAIADRIAARPAVAGALAGGLLVMAVVAAAALPVVHRIGERGEQLRHEARAVARRLREPLSRQ